MTPLVALKLGRVSNLPTVWTNTLAATVLAGGVVQATFWWVLLAMSLFYIGGMYLNDAFDATIDAAERPERPIPSGQVKRSTVMTAGFAMLGLGEILLLLTSDPANGLARWQPASAGLMLCVTIVLYNYHHKNNPLSPALMGACRMLVYIATGLVVIVPVPPLVWIGAILLFCYLIGLTYVAKQENLGQVKNLWPLVFLAAPLLYGMAKGFGHLPVMVLWLLLALWIAYAITLIVGRKPGSIPRAVVSLIAGISLVDALMIAMAGAPAIAVWAVGGFVLTLLFQRFIPGT